MRPKEIVESCPPNTDLFTYASEQWNCSRKLAKDILFWTLFASDTRSLCNKRDHFWNSKHCEKCHNGSFYGHSHL